MLQNELFYIYYDKKIMQINTEGNDLISSRECKALFTRKGA